MMPLELTWSEGENDLISYINSPPFFLVGFLVGMDASDRKRISGLLKSVPDRECFLDQLEGWIRILNNPEGPYRRPEIKPRTKKKAKAIRDSIRLIERLENEMKYLRGAGVCLNWEDNKGLAAFRGQFPKIIEILKRASEQAQPTRTDKRLDLERNALRGLMWLFAQYFPNLKISYSESSQFYKVADEMLIQIGYDRHDIRQLIREEKKVFSETRKLYSTEDIAHFMLDGAIVVKK